MRLRNLAVLLAALALAAPFGVSAPALAAEPASAEPVASKSAFERDRQAILAMAGDYRVTFDFRETVAFTTDYELLDPKRSGGYESVRVIEDTGERIVLQHLLVVTVPDETGDGDRSIVIKHWRQDWVWEPEMVLTYATDSRWVLTPVAPADRKGAWSQTVWQTDDSPRYGGVGRWRYDDGVARWTSGPTLRPLARRDAVRKPVYGWYEGINRHALTPVGWVHEQDNAKIGRKDGEAQTIVHEVVLNTYRKEAGYDVKAAETYWAATADYWAEVRKAWDAAIVQGRGVAVQEEPENGSVTGPRLMGLADELAAGKITRDEAVAEARKVIAEKTAAPKAAVAAR